MYLTTYGQIHEITASVLLAELSSNQSCLRTSVPERWLTSSMCHGQHKWIMVYQDDLTKFCILRPPTSKRASEVAYQLLGIYLLLGAPSILQSDNGSEFTAQVITELKPDHVIVHGKPRNPQSQGSVERANCHIKHMLIAWMSVNDTQNWTRAITLESSILPFLLCLVPIDIIQPPPRCHCKVANWKMTSCLQHPIQTQSSNPARK